MTAATDEPWPSPSFSGRFDLFAFIAAAAEAGLAVVLRLGPYVCAEVNYGGFPIRLRDEPGIRFRTTNKKFMEEVEVWVSLLANTLSKKSLLAPQGGPVILVQLENEYSMVSHQYGDEGVAYLQWMADLQRRLDLGVPAIMCYGAADGVVETINAFYAHEHIDQHRKSHPDQPPVWTECWTGWYDVWGAPHHTRPTSDLLYSVARFFAAGGAGVNYYMWMGGTNIGRSTMYLQVTSYDYDAPIDEFYQHTTKSRRLSRLHHVLKGVFAGAFHHQRDDDAVAVDGVYVWGDVAFICNDSENSRHDFNLPNGIQYDCVVAAKSVHIVNLDSHELLFNTADIPPEDLRRRDYVLLETTTTDWKVASEAVPNFDDVANVAAQGGPSRPFVEGDEPEELVRLTRGSSDYCFYVTKYELGAGSATVRFDAGDYAQVFVNGVRVGGSTSPLWEDRWCNRWNEYDDGGPGQLVNFVVDGLKGGVVDVCVLVASLGLVKGDWQLGERNMLDEKKGLFSNLEFEGEGWTGVRCEKWRSIGKLHGEVAEWCNLVGAEGLFTCARDDRLAPVWFRCEVRVREISQSWVLDLQNVGKGMFYVNGVLLGRFWNVIGSRPRNGFLKDSPIVQAGSNGNGNGEASQRYYHVPAWVVQDSDLKRGEGLCLHVVLFIEDGKVPSGPLPLLEAITTDNQ